MMTRWAQTSWQATRFIVRGVVEADGFLVTVLRKPKQQSRLIKYTVGPEKRYLESALFISMTNRGNSFGA